MLDHSLVVVGTGELEAFYECNAVMVDADRIGFFSIYHTNTVASADFRLTEVERIAHLPAAHFQLFAGLEFGKTEYGIITFQVEDAVSSACRRAVHNHACKSDQKTQHLARSSFTRTIVRQCGNQFFIHNITRLYISAFLTLKSAVVATRICVDALNNAQSGFSFDEV